MFDLVSSSVVFLSSENKFGGQAKVHFYLYKVEVYYNYSILLYFLQF